MSLEDLAGDIRELAQLHLAIDEARRSQDVARLNDLSKRRDELRKLLASGTAVEGDLVGQLEHELAGLRQLVSEAPPNLGLSIACTSASAGGGGSASAGFPHGKYNRAVNNDDSAGYRSRNSALQRIAWLESRLAEIEASVASGATHRGC